jgi:hypothetical protein
MNITCLASQVKVDKFLNKEEDIHVKEDIHDARRTSYFCHSKENQVELLSFSRMALKVSLRQ